MDLKYRETLPTSVRDALLTPSDGETTKKRKSKKKKLGKNGLYPGEDALIRKWWKDRSMESSAQENSRDTESKKHISDLRLRETQMQILLILEVIALESTPAEDKHKTKHEVPDEENNSSKKPRARKAQDLNVLLELHLDRLCIWHAVSLEESTAADSAKASSFSDSHMSGKKVESDAVRDFCTEVVVPFYAARLPDKCKLITRKFGVSGGISPAAKKTQSSKKDRAEPGAEVKRPAPVQKPRRSLQRVLTDEKTAAASQNRHPSLHRSHTAPSKRDTKRDSMEPLLPTVFGGSVRGGILQAKRVDNREVDLNAVARQHESKLRKVQMLVDQKKELDAAIQALRKPNRELVSNEIADESVKRSTGGGSSRKSKNPVRNPMGEGVQVMATPRGNRKKDIIGMPPLPRSLVPSRSFAGEWEDRSLGESPVMIPSSSSVRRTISFSGPDSNPFSSLRPTNSSPRKRKEPPTDLGPIHETPTRSSKLFFDEGRRFHASIDARPSSSKGKGLFRVPNLPAPRSSNDPTELMAPSTPVSSRQKTIPSSTHGSVQNLTESFQGASSSIMETPPRQRGLDSMPAPRSLPMGSKAPVHVTSQYGPGSPQAVMGTPVKESPAKRNPATEPAPVIPVTPEKSQSKSIYEQLGWDDDGMEL
jgi:DNA replication regulator SLD3